MAEEYKELKEFPGYLIYNTGKIYSLKINRFLKQTDDKHGYLQVTLYKGTKKSRTTIKVHILVAKAFISNPDHYTEINHIDCNKYNNNVTNLEWCSREYNMQEAGRNNCNKESYLHSPLTEDMVKYIPELLKLGFSINLISKLYKVSLTTIRSIVGKRSWKYLNLTIPPINYWNKDCFTVDPSVYNKLLSFNVDNIVLNSRIKVLESM